ncbi:hypothetical protein DPMN_020347 [Dreissena polymorpha]|uniref:Uncharacterized protein n=1 Tax=Dreissena polymorpha TaxID=45954 RepID=A0A9D4S849_DREPO|nr:hypothetical protein DPMN_020347 [Dreissena polymorpha]
MSLRTDKLLLATHNRPDWLKDLCVVPNGNALLNILVETFNSLKNKCCHYRTCNQDPLSQSQPGPPVPVATRTPCPSR